MIITIDGPAGAGKSTLSKELAKKLGYLCISTGYMYRGLAYIMLTDYSYTLETLWDVRIADIQACIEGQLFRYEYKQDTVTIFYKDTDITSYLKDAHISKGAAILGQNVEVRQIIRAYKRQLAQNKDIVIEGRVTGSVVFPHADLKLYVTASEQVRAQRFVADQAKRGKQYTEQQALQLIHDRDQQDMTRIYDALAIPEDAVIIDTSELSAEQALQKAFDLVQGVTRK